MSDDMSDDWRLTAGPPCPVCWHEETMRVRRNGGKERETTQAEHLEWRSPYGGACGQQVSRTDGGYWRCPTCGVVLIPREAAVLLDAVLVGPYQIARNTWIGQAAKGGAS